MSSGNVNIITPAEVKELTGKATIVKDRKLDPAIHAAQDELEQILGTTLYGDVEASYTDATPWTGRADLLELWNEYLKHFLSWKTLEIAYPDLYAEALNNGVYTRSGEDYQSVSPRQLEVLIASARGHADRWQGKLIRHLSALTSGDIHVAYATSTSYEVRVVKTYQGGIITRRSRWQYPYGSDATGHFNGYDNQCPKCE